MNRIGEVVFRVFNTILMYLQFRLLRAAGVTTVYCNSASGASALFDDVQFSYSFSHMGCTGNLDFHGELENVTRNMLASMIKPNDVFYDIGAHGGLYTITLQKKFPDLQIHSFEPQPEELYANLCVNKLSADRVHSVAVGNESASVSMTSNNRSSNYVSQQGDRTVQCVRIDDFASTHEIPAPNWVKIDIEGMELPAIRGMESLICTSQPVIVCEINHLFERYGTKISEFTTFMQSHGYTLHRLQEKSFKPIADNVCTLADLGESSDNNFWFLPNKVS